MKKLLILNLCLAGLVACSSEHVPTPQKLSQEVETLPPATVISVFAEDNFHVPKNAQIIEQTGRFKTVDNTYDELGNKVLIPRDAVISGTYTNDGVSCKVVWKSIYANKTEHAQKRGSFALGEATMASRCDPLRGIKSGDRLTIKFDHDFE